jgi:hypothetical protein
MNLVSRREFARQADVVESAVRKALECGRIALHESGKIDLDTQLPRFHANRDDSKVRTPPVVRTEVRTPRREHPDNKDLDGEGVDGDLNFEESDDGGFVAADGALLRARIRKEEFLGRLRQQEFRKRRGELVERATVEKVFFEFTRQTRDTILNFPSRLAAIQAAALLHYLQTGLSELLTAEQAAKLDKHIEIGAVEQIVNETMAGECRSLLEGLASSKLPKMK